MDNLEYKRYKVTIKEVGNTHLLTPELYGYYDRDYVIKFFGLNNKDVEWYEIEEIA